MKKKFLIYLCFLALLLSCDNTDKHSNTSNMTDSIEITNVTINGIAEAGNYIDITVFYDYSFAADDRYFKVFLFAQYGDYDQRIYDGDINTHADRFTLYNIYIPEKYDGDSFVSLSYVHVKIMANNSVKVADAYNL